MLSEVRVALMVLMVVCVSAATVVERCGEVFGKLTVCLPYATGEAATATTECCSSVAEIKPVCLCYVIELVHNGSNPQFKSLGLQESRLRLLPSACRLANARFTDCSSPLPFNFDSFSSNNSDAIIYEGSYIVDNTIRLNPPHQPTIGRATYSEPMQLWNKTTGKLTDFTTHFSFVIDSNYSSAYGDGLAFFLAPEGSRIPTVTTGSSLGLTRDHQELNATDCYGFHFKNLGRDTDNSFVAVEFDISKDPWDPLHDHVGIDINSMESVVNVTWQNSNLSIMEGRKNEAWISYDSDSQNLSVVFTGFGDSFHQHLHYIVDLRVYLPERVILGFSAATDDTWVSISLHSWSFNSSLKIDEKLTNPAYALGPGPSANNNSNSNSNPISENDNMRRRLVVGLAVGGGFILVGGLGLVLFSLWRNNGGKCEDEGEGEGEGEEEEEDHPVLQYYMDGEFERSIGPKKFSYEELVMATSNFAQQEKLGEGGFGGVYRGFLRELSSYVAVKRVSRESKQGIKEYASEVKTISRLRHRNLVQLIGWCHEKRGELLLVYEYMENGSLDFHLFKGKSLLTWGVRYKIVQGLASALLYLHEEWEQCVVHRDIKSSNVMLDSDFNAKLGDFGLARFVDHEKGAQTTVLAGTMGYMAPECFNTGQASRESDVYSFGVVALEIACGRKPIDPKAQENHVRIVEWVWDLHGMGKLLEATDSNLSANFNEQQIKRLMIVGLWCAHPDRNLRPSIRQAIHVLNSEAPLPSLPPKMPVATYYAPSVNTLSFSQSLAYGGAIVSESSQSSALKS